MTINQQWHPNQNSFYHSKLLSDTLTGEDIPQSHTATKQRIRSKSQSSLVKPGIVVRGATFEQLQNQLISSMNHQIYPRAEYFLALYHDE